VSLQRLVFAGPLWDGSSAGPRLKGLQALGLEVEALDTTAWPGGGLRLARSLRQRAFFGKSVRAMNRSLLETAQRVRPDVVWVEKGSWVYPLTLQQLRNFARFLVHYNTDDVFASGSYLWLHRRGIQSYDLYLTTNRWNVMEIRQQFGVRALRMGMGYDQDLALRALQASRTAPTAQVVFVGHWEPHTESYLAALCRAGVAIKLWGHHWNRARHQELRAAHPLAYSEYAATVARADIALCFLSRRNRNESTMRSFEIPALGAFLLAERTAEHRYLYAEGKEAEFFCSREELVEKARHYLMHPDQRRAIATAGQSRCQRVGFTWADHMRREWPIVARWLADSSESLTPEDDDPFWLGFRQGRPAPTEQD